jgi:hypothetical protein
MLRLERQAAQSPHYRHLRELLFILQELEIIQKPTKKQQVLATKYTSLLDPISLRVTTQTRKTAFTIESRVIDDLVRALKMDVDEIEILLQRAASLARRTQSGIEIRQEDHGKAILVFTMITVVFLPLSFVTSYLGMNTVDIRDMNNRQTLFWAISLPLTVAIIVLSLFVGFKHDDIQELFLTRPWSWSHGNLLTKTEPPVSPRHEAPAPATLSLEKNGLAAHHWLDRLRKREPVGAIENAETHV